MPKSLVIVESPTKARTISKFLDDSYIVESSIGHIRDLPQTAKEIPQKYKKEAWSRLGINIENGFEPLYVIPSDKKKQVAKLRSLLEQADDVYLATDEDREGESISWHLSEVLKPKVPAKRLVFHEITRRAIQEALDNPRDIDLRLVQAQETRRILDRLYGYEISPLLWKKIAPRLSAGRVQSVAVRIVVERERERMAFVRSAYWDLQATFEVPEGETAGAETPLGGRFSAQLVQLAGKRLAMGKDFDDTTGQLKKSSRDGVVLLDEQGARDLLERLRSSRWQTVKVERKPYTTRPAPPFTTSTLQQEANRKLRFSARETMRNAQRLYENGFITYMRTDSVNLSQEAVERSREVAQHLYGDEYLSPEPRTYKTRVKNAQEAHEAIRPSSAFSRPDDIRGQLGPGELKLYELIWKRTVACQMAEARGHRLIIQVGDGEAVFQASGKTIEFAGFLRAYVEGADDPEAELADKETILPELREGDAVDCTDMEAKDHSTQPPARYTEASLVKELEANGVGRPSTYASIIDTILRREYVVKQGNALVATFVAFAVVQLLERFFPTLVDVQFTAHMEDDLDAISLGEMESLPYLKSFYFGGKDKVGLCDLIQSKIDARESCTLALGQDSEGRQIDIRVGRYGPYVERGDERASVPERLAPDELNIEKVEELLAKGSGPRELGQDPDTGLPVLVKVGRYGPYVQLGDNSGGEKPKMKSLLSGMEPEEVTLEAALKLLSLPRSLGVDPETDEEVFADFGRYGPYVKRGSDSRSLTEDDDVFEVPLARAQALFREERKGGWRARLRAKVLRELGEHPDSKQTIQLLSGRYGPYVTDGEINASLPRGEDPQEMTLERAVDLLREKAASGDGRRRGRKAAKKTSKTATKKKATKKPAEQSSKTATKKKATKKTAKETAKAPPTARKAPRRAVAVESSEGGRR
ncbi:MAG: type I DNA topoisomerase [Planctomycetota bacterium]|nr:type I DNA topoisomerase [Planctomycetota bacterium]